MSGESRTRNPEHYRTHVLTYDRGIQGLSTLKFNVTTFAIAWRGNEVGSSRTGSNPDDCEHFYYGAVNKSKQKHPLIGPHLFRRAVMAKWLRRLTRNQMGSSRAGSKPDCEIF